MVCSIRDPLSIDKVEGPLRAAQDRTNGIHPTPARLDLGLKARFGRRVLDARLTTFCMICQIHMWVVASTLYA